ncbi:MAG TPA: hypothetical protein VMS74_13730 [Acidimicrobiia bacterium]|nr:hypothetical protein [Acidimicrobiia bacterium]
MSRGRERLYESGYDPESDLRLVRFIGHFELEWLVAAAPHDRTLKHLPDFQAEMGAGRVFWFTEVEDVCSWLGVTPADFGRVESLLQPVEPDV